MINPIKLVTEWNSSSEFKVVVDTGARQLPQFFLVRRFDQDRQAHKDDASLAALRHKLPVIDAELQVFSQTPLGRLLGRVSNNKHCNLFSAYFG